MPSPRSNPVRVRRPPEGLNGLFEFGAQLFGKKMVLDALDLALKHDDPGTPLDEVARTFYSEMVDGDGAPAWSELTFADRKAWRNRAHKAISALRASFASGRIG